MGVELYCDQSINGWEDSQGYVQSKQRGGNVWLISSCRPTAVRIDSIHWNMVRENVPYIYSGLADYEFIFDGVCL